MRVLSVILLLIGSVAESLKLYRVHVPHYKLNGEEAVLECEIDMGRNRLYAVKWYKDNEEFFRYVPRFNPSIHTHKVEGVHVDQVKSNAAKVVLKQVNVRSTGVYKCEVSAEAPSFASVMGEGRMTVVYLPKEGPQITGTLRDEYEVGDTLDLNCTSSKSFPPAKIAWYINDIPIIQHHDPSYYETSGENHHRGNNGKVQYGSLNSNQIESGSGTNSLIRATSRRLHLQLNPSHFGSKGTAKVRCVARIFPLFWQDGDEKVFMGNSNNSKDTSITSSNNNRKTTNEVDYSHDSLHHHSQDGSSASNTNANKDKLGFLYKREALVQIRGGSTKMMISKETIATVLLALILVYSS